ncbi:MAG: hypothetical protein K9G70_15505 [Prolixibacteraceae bacterium]|nr:hypothetical protein [Prolixibacteraceae bacterium]
MKNIIITSKDLKRELTIWFVCLVTAIGLNVYAIISYNTSWSELYSQVGYVIVLSLIIYAVSWIFRGIFLQVRYLARKR